MQTPTSDVGLPAQHGVERAASRVHRISDSKLAWADLGDAQKQHYRGLVGHLLRDLSPAPDALRHVPLIWWSPTWGILQAERGNWVSSGRKLVSPISFDRDIVMELPDDAVPMSPVQPCKPGKSLDDIRRHAAVKDREQAA